MKRWGWFAMGLAVCASTTPHAVFGQTGGSGSEAPPPGQAGPPATPPPAAAPEAQPAPAPPAQSPPPEPAPADAAVAAPAPSPAPTESPDVEEPDQRVSSSAAPSQGGEPARQWFGSPHSIFVPPYDLRRHLGFSLRVSVGLGFALAERDIRRGSSKVSGFDALMGIDIGATPMENLVVFGRIGGTAFDHARSSDSPNAGSAFFGVFGAGARYHFMPIDWYVSGVVAMTAVSVTNDLGNAQNAGPGFGMELETGKNWWAGSYREHWTVGLGIRFAYLRSGSVQARPGERSDDPWQATALSLVFSTSYN